MVERVPVPEWDTANGQSPDPAEPARTPGSASDEGRPYGQVAPGPSGLNAPSGCSCGQGGFARLLTEMRNQQPGFTMLPSGAMPAPGHTLPTMNPLAVHL